MENNIDEDENLELDASPVDLNDEIESEDDELPPPEDEKDEAGELNVGNILALIFIGVAVIFLIVMAAGSAKSKKKIQSRELDKSGSKTAIEFKEKTEKAPEVKENVEEIFGEEKKDDKPMSEKDADEVLSTLPLELQSGTAPVTPVGSRSSSSAKSDRPDTKNSKSPRKIEGIAGQNYAAANANSNIVSAVMNGNFPQTAASSRMTKEEYIAQQMQRTQQIQNSLYASGGSYGGANQSQSAAYQSNREEFFNNQGNAGGNGQFLPYNTIWDGTIISASLETAINTDNPGVVIARGNAERVLKL